jgi:transcriptional regulator with XRE-family HTH domain
MELGLKQIELADRVGTNQPYLSLIENGKTVNRGVIIQRLADALGREPGELIRNDET